MEGIVDDGSGNGRGFLCFDFGSGLIAFPWRCFDWGWNFANFRGVCDHGIESGNTCGGAGSWGGCDRGPLDGDGLWLDLADGCWRGFGGDWSGSANRAGGDEIRAAGKDFDDVGDADFAERLDGFDNAELEMEALIGSPFHPAFGLGEDVDGGEDAVRRVFVGGLE